MLTAFNTSSLDVSYDTKYSTRTGTFIENSSRRNLNPRSEIVAWKKPTGRNTNTIRRLPGKKFWIKHGKM